MKEKDKKHMKAHHSHHSHHMKPHHADAMKASHHSAAESHGVSEKEGRPWGHGEFANMPRESHLDAYRKPPTARSGILDDTIDGIDLSDGQAAHMRDRHLSHQH